MCNKFQVFGILIFLGGNMKILLGSQNPSKYQSLELALLDLDIRDYEIISYDVSSGVSSKPIGYEIIRGADNRNQQLLKIAEENQIAYDYLCSIEGGYSIDENGHPYIVTYCIIQDRDGNKSTGKSLGLRLTRSMFDYLRSGKSLNHLIDKIEGSSNHKQNGGITGYLTNGLFRREKVDKDAVLSAFLPILYQERRDILDREIQFVKKR